MWSLSDRAMAGSARRVASATAPRLAGIASIARGCLWSGCFQKKLPGTRPTPVLTMKVFMLLGGPFRPFTPAIKCLCFSLRIGLPRCYRPVIAEAAKRIRVLDAGWFDFFCLSHIQSNYKAQKLPFVFWRLQGNREFKVLCSSHSTADVRFCRRWVGGCALSFVCCLPVHLREIGRAFPRAGCRA